MPYSEIMMASSLKPGDDPRQLGREAIIKIFTVNDGLVEGRFRWEYPRNKDGGIGPADAREDPVAFKLPESSLKLTTTNGPLVVTYT